MNLYVNGNLEDTKAYSTTIGINTSTLNFGGPTNYTGYLDDVLIYNHALEASEVLALYNNPPSDSTAPAAPTGLSAIPGNTTVDLTWTSPADPDVKGYNVYSSTTSPVSTDTPVNGALITTESYTVNSLANGTPYFFTVIELDTSGNPSAAASEATATPAGGVTCYALTLASGANGSAPTASPTNSTGCSSGQYLASEAITLTAHPDSGYQVATWSGTNNDTLKTLTNTLSMPASIRTVTANYEVIPAVCYALTLTSGANGSTPTASPTNSTGCSAGQYVASEAITLTAHPDSGYRVVSWNGTNDDALKTLANSLTMPANIQTVTVNYGFDTSALCGSDPTLVGCWQMEENGGTALVDGSSFLNDGALVNPIWVAGKTGSFALNLNGTPTATIADNNSLDITNTITIAAWIKPMGAVATQTLVTKNLYATDGSQISGYELNLSSAGKVFIRLNNNESVRVNSVTSYPVSGSAWMHVAATYDGTNLKIYINGVQDNTLNIPGITINPNSLPITLGRQTSATPRAYNGYLDDVRIYNRALTLEEIQVLAGISSTPPDAPTDLTATPTSSLVVTLSWSDNSDNETGFEIERSTTGVGGTYNLFTTTAADAETYPNTGLTPLTEYCYRVRAVNGIGGSTYAGPVCATTLDTTPYGLQFDGSNDYVRFSPDNGLGATNFTLETWFYWAGGGVTTSTGSTGLPTAYPLITKGRTDGSDGTNKDINYFFGIDSATSALSVDFEEYRVTGGGQNYPYKSTTVVTLNTWHHAAVTYDSVDAVYTIYLDGNVVGTSDIGSNLIPRYDSIVPTALGTAFISTGVAAGSFNGKMDEVRIWNVVRTAEQIRADINHQLTSGTGLVARWGMDEGSGSLIASSIGTFPGTLTNGPVWITPGAPFNISFDTEPPAAPTLLTAIGANAMVTLDWADNSESDLAGYNIYRGTVSGVYTKINSSLIVPSTHIDTGLTNGTEYYYVVRAVDTSGNESGNSNEGYAIPTTELGAALHFDGVNDYITFGNVPGLGVTDFTLETWFYWTGGGTTMTTSATQGLPSVYPLISHGRGEADGTNLDMNYFLGIDSATHALAVDFEDWNGTPDSGMNYPFIGTTPVTINTWHHAAVTYDSVNAIYRLYLDGAPAGTYDIPGSNILPRSDSIQHASIASALTSTGSASGYFEGDIDEARIWNVVRTQNEILGSLNQQITSGTGLVARWGMNEGGGTSIASSVGTFPGTLTGGPTWVPGAPFNLDLTPATPTLVAPADLASGVSTSANLTVHVSDAHTSPLTVSFYGRQKDGPPGADFTLVAIPDPQNYAASYPAIYNTQMDWVVANKTTSNIQYVLSLGDNVNTTSNSSEWTTATTAWDRLTTGGVPYGLTLGNHDGAPSATTNFNTAFGSRLSTQPTYGGRPDGASDYDNTYATFSASGMDFIVLFIEYGNSTTDVLNWANGVLANNPSKRAIVVTHDLLSGNSFSSQGSAIYNALKGNQNLFLMLGGHLDTTGQRQEVATNGNAVYALRSDYQSVDSQQSGYLRIMRFSPTDSQIHVSTYSPNQDKNLTDIGNLFDLAYAMDGVADFSLIGSTSVPSGSDASVTWSGLLNDRDYEWYAVADNGGAAAVSPTWSFTTETATNNSPVITESDPQAVTMSEDSFPTAFNKTLHATDPEGNTLDWSISSPASNGTASASGTGTTKDILYTPVENYFGSDSFVVQVSDGNGGVGTITVNVTITPVNDAPVITGQNAVSTPEDTTLTITFADLHVTDPDNPYPSGFSLTVLPGMNYTFVGSTITPASNFNGALTVPVQVNDENADSNVFDLSVTVSPVNDAPACLDVSLVTPEDTAGETAPSCSDVEPGDILTYSIVAQPTNGSASVAAGILSYTPAANYYGPDTFTYRAYDGTAYSTAASVNVTVTPVVDLKQSALVLVNSESADYSDFQNFIQTYLDHFGIPYTVLDIASTSVQVDVNEYALLVIGHRNLDSGSTRYLTLAEETFISDAIDSGVGLVNFDNTLSADGSTGRYQFIADVFTFGYNSTTSGAGVTFADPTTNYIIANHSNGQVITTNEMSLAGINLPGDVTSLAASGTQPFLAVTSYGSGRAVQFGSYDWISHAVKGPLFGLDDLFWRSMVWAARKPFVMQGLPPFVTMRMDDVSGPLWWIHTANDYGFIPWAGIFTNDIDASEAADLSALVIGGKATSTIHAFNSGTGRFFYYDHNSGTNYDDTTVAANFTEATQWFADNNIPIGKYVTPHYYEIGSNAFANMQTWDTTYITTMMDPGQNEASAPWMMAGPFRLYETGTAYDRDYNIYYADYISIPGHPELNGEFFNCTTEIRDVTGYEWLGNGRTSVPEGIADGTEWLKRPLDSMAIATLFSHEYTFVDSMAESDWQQIMQGITTNIAGYSPIYVSMDYACAYARAVHDSNISASTYDPATNRITVDLNGTNDMPTKFYVFTEDGGQISQQLVDVPTITGTQQVNYTLPGPLDHIAVSPTSANLSSGATQQFTASGFDADNNPINTLSLTWSVVNGGGTINPNGLFTAGVTPGAYTNTVQAAAGSVTGTATVHVAAPPDEGPGGPILVVRSTADGFGSFYAEILRAEGLNAFTVTDISNVSAGKLADYEVVILAQMTLTDSQAAVFSDWVTAGGNLIAMHPDARLASLLGLSSAGTSMADAYLLVDTASGPGAGIVNQTIQYHGNADLFTLEGATAIANLYSDATTSTSNPAVTIINVGSNGGQAAAFTYDLARSVVYTRQGNPAWAGTERDGTTPIRSDDMFYGAASGDPQTDWIDLSKVAIPQADEQQRLLANMIQSMNLDNMPLPRFWYFPHDEKAVVIMTADDHGSGDVTGRIDRFVELSPTSCSVEDWECIRSTAYIYNNSQITNAQALNYQNLGFEVAYHVNTGCSDWTSSSLASNFSTQLSTFASVFPDVQGPVTERTHCIVWSDWATQPKVELANGIRLDTNYYYWPPAWINNLPGMFTGSGMPMRFADLDGTPIDVFQATTQMTDESGQSYPYTIDTLLDRALGSEGYYGAFTANIHTDGGAVLTGSEEIVASAIERGVPVVSAAQMLTWLDGRNNSTFSSLDWQDDTLSFSITAASGARGLRAMLPIQSDRGLLTGITRAGSPVTTTTATIKGVQYAFFDAQTGAYLASYEVDATAPTISDVTATNNPDGTVTVTWTTDEPATSRVDYGTAADSLILNASNAALVTSHVLSLSGLLPNTTYHFRTSSADGSNNTATSPQPPAVPLTFTTPLLPLKDETGADFNAGTLSCAYVSTTTDGELILPPTNASEFNGTSLPSGWEGLPWDGSGSVVVSDGKLSLNYAYARTTDLYTAGRALEFTATFSDATTSQNQHAGFGYDLNTGSWAIFSTGPGGTALKARSTGVSDTDLGTGYLGSPHRFRIEWYPNHIVYFIDGTQVADHTVSIPGNMRPIASDGLDSATLSVDWMRMSPFTGPCTFTSRVFDAGSTVNWQALNWTAGTPTGASLAFGYRLGNTPTPDGAWTTFVTVPTSGNPISGSSRYAQYRVTLDTTNTYVTPDVQDVTFTYGIEEDTTAPTIIARVPDVDATNIAISADVNITFSELLEPSTVDETSVYLQASGDSSDIPATVTLAGNLVTLTPSAEFGKGQAYTVTVKSSLTDMAGNPLESDVAWEFTTLPDSKTDTTVSDFAAGSGACVIDETIGDGALRLSATVEENFTGSALPAGWSSRPWTGGTATIGSGSLAVDGASARNDTLFSAGRTLEFVATFKAESFQHFGFGGGDITFNQGPIVMFSTRNSTSTLYTSLYLGSSYYDVVIPNGSSLIGTPHTYRIDWKTDGFDFYVDGTLVSSRTNTVSEQMRVAASDYNLGGTSLTVDWMRLSPYVSPCNFTSRVLDAGSFADWLDLNWDGTAPAGTTVSFETRTGNTATPDESWSVWQAVNSPVASPDGRYIQYRTSLASTDPAQTPVIESILLTYAAIPNTAPQAVDDTYTIAENAILTVDSPGVLVNDSDAESNPLTAIKLTDPSSGNLLFNGNGSFSYTPAANFHGEVSFIYKANDGLLDSNEATVSITVTPIEYTLTLVSAHGPVTKTPNQATYHYGDVVTLGVTADPGWTFSGWTPALMDDKVTINGNTTVMANFTQNEYTLTIVSEHGTVTKTPNQTTYHYGDIVTLSVEADPGWIFTGWNGEGCSGTGTCQVTMDAAKSVTATFTQNLHSLSLISGWNLVSFNLHPINTAIASVLSSISGNYDLVYAWDATGGSSGSGNWLKYDPALGYGNTLTSLDETRGFWIHMTEPAALSVMGSNPTTTSIDLFTAADNWNLVGYATVANHTLPEAFSTHGTGTDFSLVYAYHANESGDPWMMFDRTGPAYANELVELSPGWGYWIKVNANHTWSISYSAP